MTTSNEFSEIGAKLSATAEPFEVVLHGTDSSDDPLGDALTRIGAAIVDASKELATLSKDGDGAGLPGRPALELIRPGVGAVRYLAVPEGPERGPFVELLAGEISGGGALSAAQVDRLAALTEPAELQVFIAAACPHCPQAVRAAHRLALASTSISVTVVDAQRFPELAEQFKARAVPQTVLDGGFTWTGVVPSSELAERVLARDGATHGDAELASLVEAGRLDAAAARIREGGAGHFLAVWRGSTTATRIPLMMLAEELLEDERNVLSDVNPELIELLAAEDAALRGDTADLLGQIGDPASIPGLRRLAADPNPDVAEIAAEAIEAIEEVQNG